MDKKLILAVAGSGKTSLIIDHLNLESKSLIVTYTDNNFAHLKRRVLDKFGFFPKGVKIFTYFSFLYSFCYKPFLLRQFPSKGIYWDPPPEHTRYLKRHNPEYYISSSAKLYYNRLAKLLEIKQLYPLLNQRVEKYFQDIFVDEVQDFAGHDFNLLMSICRSKVNIILVGDYFQHTFDTSRDSSVNKKLHDDLNVYQSRFAKTGVQIDSQTLSHSYRCSPTICEFLERETGIPIYSHRNDETLVHLIEDPEVADEKFKCQKTVKLFYQKHSQYQCYSQNWGASKGQDHYQDVCVVLNPKTYNLVKAGKLSELPPKTRNKFYVACTRARGNLYLVPDKLLLYRQR